MSAWKHCPHCLRGYTGPDCRCTRPAVYPREQALLDAIEEAIRCLGLVGHRDGTLRRWGDKASAAADVLNVARAEHVDAMTKEHG